MSYWSLTLCETYKIPNNESNSVLSLVNQSNVTFNPNSSDLNLPIKVFCFLIVTVPKLLYREFGKFCTSP